MKYELILLDVDGTTVASNGKALPSTRVVEAVQKAKDHIQIAFATGRPLGLTKTVIDALDISGPGIFNGGAEIIDMQTGKITQRAPQM